MIALVNTCFSSELVASQKLAYRLHEYSSISPQPRILSQAQLIERIKKVSSKWIKALDVRYRGFFWQRGYAAFSVSPSQLDSVLEYVDRQQEHHHTRTFQEEYRELLRRHAVDFDERHVWD